MIYIKIFWDDYLEKSPSAVPQEDPAAVQQARLAEEMAPRRPISYDHYDNCARVLFVSVRSKRIFSNPQHRFGSAVQSLFFDEGEGVRLDC